MKLIVLINFAFLLLIIIKFTKSITKLNNKIELLTHYDLLTELPNQYVLEQDLETLLHNEDGHNFSLIMIAIDHFSFINQSFGYKSGDTILCELADRIRNEINKNYRLYRYKGDEFVILGNDTLSEAEIDLQAQRILKALAESSQIDGKTIELSINIGIYIRTEDTKSEDPLKAVTQAMNYAKYLGSNQIQKFQPDVYKKLHSVSELQTDIISGLREEQFFLVYQPLFYLCNGQIAEIEALIRWEHPEKGLLYPDQFIELAEQTGKIVKIDYWVLETACKQLKNWKNHNVKPVLLSVNLSSKTFETKEFIPYLIEMIKRHEIDPTFLQLEITERVVINNIEECINKFKKLRTMGIHIALDDFGIGYSSLNYIIRLPLDSIKIDKSFIKNITSSKEAEAIVAAIINLCMSVGLKVIAEGIECRTVLDYLICRQCDIGQGYYFSKPVSIHEIEKNHLNELVFLS